LAHGEQAAAGKRANLRKQQVEPGSNSVPLLDLLPGRLHCAADYNQPDSSANSGYSWAPSRGLPSARLQRQHVQSKLVHAAFRTISLAGTQIKRLPIWGSATYIRGL